MLNTKLHLNKDFFTADVNMTDMRAGFSHALTQLIEENKDVFVLTADLASSLKILHLAEKFPKNYIQVGVAEQNMAGIAAGLALSGKIPFITSFAIFNPGRNWEQIRLSICSAEANVKIIGSHAGLSHSFDGGVAQCLEDIALTRVLPNLTVLSPCDYNETIKATRFAEKHKGSVYIRIARGDVLDVTTENTPFEFGKMSKLIEGTDVTIIATGSMVAEALIAAKDLKGKHKISAEVLNASTLKPFDKDSLVTSAKKTGLVVSVEDHQINAGLGGIIAEILSEEHPTKMIRIGVEDKFGESGTYEQLKTKYGLSAHHIVRRILEQKGGINE